MDEWGLQRRHLSPLPGLPPFGLCCPGGFVDGLRAPVVRVRELTRSGGDRMLAVSLPRSLRLLAPVCILALLAVPAPAVGGTCAGNPGYPDDPRVGRLHPNAGGVTSEDLIVAFSDGVDDDGNGYVDDISGWNFHRDTNDPQTDNSAYGHANGESRQALAETDNALSTAGMCPKCRLLSVKCGDEAIDRPDRVAEGITFAVDSGAKVIIGVIASAGLLPGA